VWPSARFSRPGEDFVELLSDSDERCAFTEFLQLESPDICACRAQASENVLGGVIDRTAVWDLHRLSLRRPVR